MGVAIQFYRQVLRINVGTPSARAVTLAQLAFAIIAYSYLTGKLVYLDEAERVMTEALDSPPDVFVNRPRLVADLAALALVRYVGGKKHKLLQPALERYAQLQEIRRNLDVS